MKDGPLISVVIPTCHRNDLLAKCLACLAPGVQTLDAERYEVIVTDDGSASTAEQMIHEQYPWATWTQGPRKGPAANRNHGASLAQSEWIAFTDDDCLPDFNWLQVFVDAINPGTNVYEGRTTCRDWPNSPLFEAPINETGGYLWSCNFIIARSLFEKLEGFDERFPYAAMEDVDFRERIRDLGQQIEFASEAVVDHPVRPRRPYATQIKAKESEAFFFRKRFGRVRIWKDLLYPILHTWSRGIVKGPHRFDMLALTPTLVRETWTAVFSQAKWRKKHESIIANSH